MTDDEQHADEQHADLIALDREHLWHPYSSALAPSTPYLVESASGVRLRLRRHDGQACSVNEAMSSWWCAVHGYAVPELDRAAGAQLGRMSHVMFGGLTHEPAVALARRLIELAPRMDGQDDRTVPGRPRHCHCHPVQVHGGPGRCGSGTPRGSRAAGEHCPLVRLRHRAGSRRRADAAILAESCGFRPPSTPDGISRLRITAHAHHTGDKLAYAAKVLSEVSSR